jgi:hypothetical protein
MEALSLCLPSKHWFPNLRSLDLTFVDDILPYIRTPLAPRINSLDLEIKLITTMSHLSLVPLIAVKCPDLTFAQIECSAISPDLIPHLLKSTSSFVRGLKHIETLRVNDLDQSAFEHLATLSTLKS